MLAADSVGVRQSAGSRSAVYATAFAAAVLVGCEFLPVSLLSPIARDFSVTEGQAGQVISISGLFAVLTSLSIARLTAGIDRRIVVASMMAALLLSCLVVAAATSFTVLMAGRALLGIAVGGFWSFSTAVIMRLLPAQDVPKGLAMLGSAVAISSTIAAPLASNLGEWIGWRGTFLVVVPVTAFAFLWLWISLPKLPTTGQAKAVGALPLLRQRQVLLAMIAVTLSFMGQFVIFTYVRPLLETVAGFSVPAMSGVLLAMGLSGVMGAWWVGHELRKSLFRPLIALPALLAMLVVGMILFGASQHAMIGLFVVWGFISSAAGVGWGLWLSRALPDQAEAGGGLQVAAIQLAIAGGALLGGLVLDQAGWQASLGGGALVLVAASLAAALTAMDFSKSKLRPCK